MSMRRGSGDDRSPRGRTAVTRAVLFGPILVRGLPAPFATRREKEWRATVAANVKTAWHGGSHIRRPCEISLTFRLPPDKVEVTDIDNLLKATIDGIGSVLFERARTGHQVPWNTEDYWIFKLVAEKVSEADPERVGVEVMVTDFG